MREQIRVTQDCLAEYEEYLRLDEKSPCTISQYVRDVRGFFNFLEEKLIRKDVVISYKEKLLDKYMQPATINAKLCAVNSFLTFLGVPMCRVKALRVQRRMFCDQGRQLDLEEYERLVMEAKKQDTERMPLLLQTIGSTGIRVSELKFVTVEGVKKNDVEVTAKGKRRRIFLTDQLREQLLRYAKAQGIESGPIFVSRNGNPLDRSNIWHAMKALCEGAGVAKEKVFPHNLRHLFARRLYEAKKDLAHLADILGHTSVETTRIYTISSGREYEKTIESLGFVL